MRLKDCMLNKDFSKKLRSNNGHIYMKVLYEEIADELKLNEVPAIDEFKFDNYQPN